MTMVLALALTQGVSAQDNTNIKDAYQSEEFAKYIKENNTGLWYVPEYK